MGLKLETKQNSFGLEKRKAVANSVEQSRGHSLSPSSFAHRGRPNGEEQERTTRAEQRRIVVVVHSKRKQKQNSCVASYSWRDLAEEEEAFYDYYRSKAAEFLNAEQQRGEEKGKTSLR